MTDILAVKAAFDAADQFLHPILDRGRQMNILVDASMKLTLYKMRFARGLEIRSSKFSVEISQPPVQTMMYRLGFR